MDDLAISRVVRRYFKSIFFSFLLHFFPFFPSLGNSRLLLAPIVRVATSKFFANGPLMAGGYTRVVFSNEPVGVSSLITRITSTGKPSVRTRETTPFPSTTSRPLRILRHSRWPVRDARSSLYRTEERIANPSCHRGIILTGV